MDARYIGAVAASYWFFMAVMLTDVGKGMGAYMTLGQGLFLLIHAWALIVAAGYFAGGWIAKAVEGARR